MLELPASPFCSPAICRSKVDLPEPEAPNSATISPGITSSETPLSAARPPAKVLWKLATEIALFRWVLVMAVPCRGGIGC